MCECFLGAQGRGLHRGGDLLEGCRRLFERRGLLLGTAGELVGGRGEFAGIAGDGASGCQDVLHGLAQNGHRLVDVALEFGKGALEMALHVVGQVGIGQGCDHAADFVDPAVDVFRPAR
jgi:hypothetical protein